MKKVLKGEKISRSIRTDGDLVTIYHVTKHGKGDAQQAYALTWKFDYTDVSRDELIQEASRAHVIDMRPGFKALSVDDAEKTDGAVIGMRVWLDRERRKAADKVSQGQKLLEKMSPEERALLIQHAKEMGLL